MNKTVTVTTEQGTHEYTNTAFAVDEGNLYLMEVSDNAEPRIHSAFAPGCWDVVTDYHEREDRPLPDAFEEIAGFMIAGNQTVPLQPTIGEYEQFRPFIHRVAEEVRETIEAVDKRSLAGVVDGFLDTAYVAITGAIRAAGVDAARECWEAILDANTAKIDGRYGEIKTDPGTGKILKPEGWTAPNIARILYQAGQDE